ncbi:unnamed protein product [Brassica rapa subsp. narinosa]
MNKTTLVSSTFENPSTRLCFFLLFLAQTTVLSRQKPFRWLNTRSDQRSYIYFVMVGGEKQSLTPKEIIHHKFGVNASYRIEQVHVSSQSTCLYRCHLQLPDFSVVSNVFKRKKDAELSAAELALEKLGIHPQGDDDDDDDDDITVEQAWDDIVERIKYIFSDEFLSSDHPLGSHLRATLQRDGERRGSLPLSVIAAFDAKINSRCKVINPSVDKDPILAMSYVMKAAAKLSDYIVVSPHVASLRRKSPYPPAVVEALATHGESIKVEAVYIQCATSGEEVVDLITLDISSGRYYLDIIAEKLGLKDSSQLIISRTFGKTPSGYECRVYSAIPKLNPSDKSSKAYGKRPVDDEEDQSSRFKNPWNAKASSACGQDTHGDAIVAALGYSWRSNDLEHDDVSLKSFYRICCGMSPNGIYKFSRQALIAATLPFSFTTKSSWRGPLPREMLSIFCRQQQLAEPVFTISTSPVKLLSETLRSFKKLKDSESNDGNNQCVNEYAGSDDSFNHYNSKDEEELPVLESGYRCGVKILSKSLQDLVLDCSPGRFYEKESHAIQNSALKALTWFGSLFDDLDADPEQPRCYTKGHMNWMFTRNVIIKGKFPSSKRYEEAAYDVSKTMDMDRKPKRVQTIPNGSLVSISYSVSVEVEADFWGRSGKCLRELIESNEEIEFEVGVGSMNPHLESVVTQMSVGQYACFVTNMPAEELVLADANDTMRTRSLLSKLAAGLEYNVHLLGVKGPTEKRVESVFFKPPLSKQRVGYAVKLIKESSASTLVDFGCGSGSLLESLLEVPTSLQTIVGVDISQKALDRTVKLGIHPQDDDDHHHHITVEEGWDDIVERIKYIFSDEFLSSDHPLGSHLRATLQRDCERRGSVPVSVITTFDSKINSLCKVINTSMDSDPTVTMSYIMKAALKLSDYIVVSPHAASLRRKSPYPPAIIEGLATHVESIKVEAVHIKCTKCDEEVVEPVVLDISSDRYYLDTIAEKLGLKDASQVMISRAISKTLSGYECRVYSAIPKLTSSNDLKESRNAKASFVCCGQDIHGDAILASVGYTGRSHDLEHEDVTLKSFYRICCGMSPNGIYKISRKALIAAQLPLLFTRESNWRGPFPREILCMFCQQQQLAEPVFTTSTAPAKSMSDLLSSFNKIKDDSDNQYLSRGNWEMPGSGKGYRCEVKIFSKSQELVLDCSLKKLYEEENDAIQNAALKALSWFSMFFGDMDVESLEPCYTDDDLNIQFNQRNRFKETFPSSRVYQLPEIIRNGESRWYMGMMPWEKKRVQNIANGSLVSICYSVYLKKDAEYSKKGKSLKELIESNEEIEFQVGHGSMNPHLESVVTQMSVGQHVHFSTGLPAEALVLAAANDTAKALSLLSGLEYSVILLGVKGPTEERMEKANIVEKLGIRPQNDDLTVDEAWDDLVGRIKYIFSDEFLSAEHPLGAHLRAALRRKGDCSGSVPVSVIATFDAKINSRCKIINPSVESDPLLVISSVMEAAAKLPDFIVASPNEASLRRKNPYPPAVVEALATQVSVSVDSRKVNAAYIPCKGEEIVELDSVDVSSGRYYLDSIAERLCLKNGNQVMISRTLGKASCGSECRLYSPIPKCKSSEVTGSSSEESSRRNARASYICGQDVHGDAVLASVGYRWKSEDLDYDDVTVKSFYRICCGMSPNGIYKISRQAVLAAQLPASFTTKSNWRGPFPREILSMFCHQHRLADPVFAISTAPVKSLADVYRSHKKLKVSGGSDDADDENLSKEKEDAPGLGNGFRCEVKVLTKSQDLVLECSPRKFYEKENDAVQNASLKALLWFSKFFDDMDVGSDTDDEEDIKSPSTNVFTIPPNLGRDCSGTTNVPSVVEKRLPSITNGSVVSICYSLSLEVDPDFPTDGEVSEGNEEDMESEEDAEYYEPSLDLIESHEEIEFEIGTKAMNPLIETAVTQMTVGEFSSFNTTLFAAAEALLLAVASDTTRIRDLLSKRPQLVYSIILLGVKGPSEERMEAAFFKPPLSKQRVEYAVKHIKDSSASTLADFGCGSGSLLDSLLDYPTTLQTIIGVDISPKGLARAAKMLHVKLNKEACNVNTATLYDGSILEFDSRLYDIDIGTCLEVIEHMEEDQACEFGEKVLSLFRPKLLIVSTPNFEYNTILQRTTTPETQEENKSESQLPKFRNHDHKFEWTREQFNHWATKLAERHNYSLEFSGVGGSGEVEPGFASQIAVFKREALVVEKVAEGSMQPYKVIWEWKKGNEEKKE